MLEKLRLPALTLAVAALGGAVFALLQVPLAWMIGAMVATTAMGWFFPVAVSQRARPMAMMVLGTAFGMSFSGPVLGAVTAAAPWLAVAGVITLATGFMVAGMFTRLAKVDPRTGFFCGVPGGVVVMVVLAQEAGAQVAAVTLAQTMRVVVVVLTIPPLLGVIAPHGEYGAYSAFALAPWWPGLFGLFALAPLAALALKRLGFGNPWMFGPCLLNIAVAASDNGFTGMPPWLVSVAQIIMGCTLGARLNRGFLLASRGLLVASLWSAVVLVVVLAVLALLLAWVAGLPWPAVVLGMAPGGMPEMALTAKALDLAVPLVLGFHLVRSLLSNVVVKPLYKLGIRWGLL
jgi:membrane AbrB-like protein